jgi:dihydropteroate synthase
MLQAAGVAPEQVVFDVGIGFGKSVDHNLELLGRMGVFTQLGRPLLLGVSRKSFLGRISGAPVEGRLPGALAATCLAVVEGVAAIRTHDVAETVQALRVAEAILAWRRTT